ncbi:MAG: biopolymer transporter ExbD, partial [Candidatus Omnitrophota bacterium]
MISFESSEYERQKPVFQFTPLIDIMFLNLVFFMALYVYFQFETELNISVPKAKESTETSRAAGEII